MSVVAAFELPPPKPPPVGIFFTTEMSAPFVVPVAIFIAGHSAWAEGVGEILTPMNLPKHYFLVVSINKSLHNKQKITGTRTSLKNRE
jgi:hypothetical protein